MNIRPRSILLVAPVALALVSWLPHEVIALDFSQGRVTQVVQDVKVVPSGSAARPAALNETVHQGSAVQTGTQSRSELTFQDQTITRLGENTIFTVGQGARTVELGSGQFLLYVPKKAGGAKVKMGSVTAAITGTTVLGNVHPDGLVQFTVLEGSACMHLDKWGQAMYVQAGQRVTYDPMTQRFDNPVDVDIQQQLSSPLVADFRRLPSYSLIEEEIAIQHGRANDELARAVAASGATIETASAEQFLAAFNSVIVSADPRTGMCDRGKSSESKARPGRQDRRGSDHFGPASTGILQRFQTTGWQRNSLRVGPVHSSIGDRRGSVIGAPYYRCGVGSGTDAARLHFGGNAVPGTKRFQRRIDNCSASDRETFAGVA